MLGGALYAQRYWQEARAAFRADEAENPWGADAILHAAKTLQQEGRHGAADAEARRALTVVPNYAEASLTLARVAYARSEDAREAKRTGEQKEHLRRARTWTHYTLGFAPRHPEAWKLAGYVAIREHRWRDAVDAWRRSLANRTHDDRLRDSLAALEADLPRLLQGGRIRETKR
jgi:tetratricopeptide (TPR) repeat protein